MFIISYAVVTVKARLVGFDRHLEEAAMDLGADEWTTFRKVTLPLIAPAILSALLLGFALSIDDFVITYFNSGCGDHVPALRLGCGAHRRAAAGQCARYRDLRDRVQRRRHQHRRPEPPSEGNRMTVDLQQAARDHLWMHFTRMGGYRDGEIPIIVSGDGCYLTDSNGKRYLDALAGLFSVNIGYGFGEEIGQAALEQMRELPFYTNWSYAHPRAIELAREVASLAPGDLNRVFFVVGRLRGGRVGLEARAPVLPRARRQAGRRPDETRHDEHVGTPPPRKYKAIARQIAYHGTTMGALSINGIPALARASSRSCPRCGT